MLYNSVRVKQHLHKKCLLVWSTIHECEGLSNLSDKQCRVGVVCFARVLKV